ncbi:MAG: S49 family peptidase [gamma proteobacterium symbiont of Clathrolucina costata]
MSDNTDTVAIDRGLVTELLTHSQKELRRQRRDRYFGIFFKAFLFIGFFVAAFVIGGGGMGAAQGDKHKPHVAFVEVYGPIMSGQLADADRLIPALQEAFKEPLSKAVALRINSPGGSPVHAGRLYNEINELQKQYPDKPVYAVIEDMGASAAYYIASAADKIYVDQASMVGSIGVITAGFGYDKIMEKVGVERRVLTSGTNKALLDPYSPADPKVQAYWKTMLAEIHEQFISAVKAGRGDRLHTETPDLFSGLVWTGAKSIEIGLSDGLGSMASVSRDTIGGVNMVNYTPPPDFLKQLSNKTHAELTALKYELSIPTLF